MSFDENNLYQGLRVGAMLGRTPRTPFLESHDIPNLENATAVSIACRRLNLIRKTDRIYIAYVSNGIGHVTYASPMKKMSTHNWIQTYFEVEADDIEICFDGSCLFNGTEGREFITNSQPWIFWVHDGKCYGQILGNLGRLEFAAENCSKVTAIKDFKGDKYKQGYGFVLFMLVNGSIYSRQLIDGNWSDAEYVDFGPAGVTWVDIQAFRTWDYRIGLQGLTSDGHVYELFTQLINAGQFEIEHFDLNINVFNELTPIEWSYGSETEHFNLNIIFSSLYGGLYYTGEPIIIDAYNTPDDNDWGKIAVFIFDKHLVKSDVESQPSRFFIIDSRGVQFAASFARLEDDGLTVTLGFSNYNAAIGVCKAVYKPGTIHSMAGYLMNQTEHSWVPQNLVPPEIPLPEVSSIINI